MILGDNTTCLYPFLFDKKDTDNTDILQYFVMGGQGICMKVNSDVAHMFYVWSFSHNTEVPIKFKHNK